MGGSDPFGPLRKDGADRHRTPILQAHGHEPRVKLQHRTREVGDVTNGVRLPYAPTSAFLDSLRSRCKLNEWGCVVSALASPGLFMEAVLPRHVLANVVIRRRR